MSAPISANWHIWRRADYRSEPASEEAFADLMSVDNGGLFLQQMRRARSIRQLQLFWALVDIVLKNDQAYENASKNSVRWDIFKDLGEMNFVVGRGGVLHVQPKSIAMESMPAAEFNDLFTRCINLICTWTGNQPKEIRDQVFAMVADKRYPNAR